PRPVGRSPPAAVEAARIRPPTALPVEKPTARTTWFRPMALAVSVTGVTARMAWGMAAENPPTPNPRTALATTEPARAPRAAPAAHPGPDPAGHEPQDRERHQHQAGLEGGQPVAVAGPLRGLGVTGD